MISPNSCWSRRFDRRHPLQGDDVGCCRSRQLWSSCQLLARMCTVLCAFQSGLRECSRDGRPTYSAPGAAKCETSGPEAARLLHTGCGRAESHRLATASADVVCQSGSDWNWADRWGHQNVRGTAVCLELGPLTEEHPEREPDHRRAK